MPLVDFYWLLPILFGTGGLASPIGSVAVSHRVPMVFLLGVGRARIEVAAWLGLRLPAG